MKRWPTKRLDEFAEVIRGVSFDKSQVFDAPGQKRVPILRAGNIQDTLLTDSDLVYVPAELVSKEQRMKRGDLAVCMSSGSPAIVGKSAHLDTDWDGSVGAFCAIVRFGEKLHHRFGSYWFRSPAFMQWRDYNAKGANIQNLRRTELESLAIPVPPLAEQERIVKLLDEADKLRKMRAQADRRTATLTSALFHEMFGDPDVNPKRWRVVPLGGVVQAIEFGISEALSSGCEYQPGRIAVLRIANITGEGTIDYSDLRYLKVSDAKRSQLLLKKGELLFNWRNSPKWVGKTAIFDFDEPCIFASFLFRLRVAEDSVDRFFLWFYLNHLRQNGFFESKCRKAVSQANFGRDELAAVQIILPPLTLQKKFAVHVEEIHAVQAKQATSRRHLDRLFQSLLHRAFNAEL